MQIHSPYNGWVTKKGDNMKKPIVTIFSMVAALSMLLAAVTPVFAKATDPTTTAAKNSGPSDAQIVGMFHHDLTMYNQLVRRPIYLDESLDHAMQVLISRENTVSVQQGKKVYGTFTPGEYAALYANLSRLNTLQAFVKGQLDSHPGFDNSFNVINSGVALNTVHDLDVALAQMRLVVIQASSGYQRLLHTR
jgi:hypothetical protein